MTTPSYRRGPARPARPEVATHVYAVGESVVLNGTIGRPAASTDIFQITAQLPPRGGVLQYRIRNDEERHERVATQDSLEPVGPSSSDAASTLIERTFGHGQRTEA